MAAVVIPVAKRAHRRGLANLRREETQVRASLAKKHINAKDERLTQRLKESRDYQGMSFQQFLLLSFLIDGRGVLRSGRLSRSLRMSLTPFQNAGEITYAPQKLATFLSLFAQLLL